MKNIYKKLTLLLTVGLLLIVSCSKEDTSKDTSKDPVTQKGSDISRSQVVTVNLPNVTLSENEYQATLDGVAVTLTKSEDNKLLFLLPYSTTLGAHTLTIPSLNNTTISYNVINTLLSGTPEETMAGLFTNLNSFSASLEATPESVNVQNSIENFKKIFDNSTLADKTKTAILYKANKALFDDIILNDYSSVTGRPAVTGRLKPSDIVVLAKHSYAVWVMAAGALVTIYAPEPAEKVLGVAITAVGAIKAIKFFNKLTDEQLESIRLQIGGFDGINNKLANSTLIFHDNVEKTVSLNSKDRSLIQSDENKTQTTAVSFFKVHKTYNFYAGKINGIIEWVNKNVLFANFSLVPLEVLPVTSPEVKMVVNSDAFKNIKFSVTDSNLALVSSTLESDGQLKLKIKINGTPNSFPVKSFLNYSYVDDFSSFSGKVPIEVSKDCSNSTLSLTTLINGYSATALVTGGVSPYTYLWSNGSTSQTVKDLAVGSYSVEVKDAFGCSKSDNLTIGCKDAPVITSASWVCNTPGDGVVARVSFSAGTTGILIGGGAGSCDMSSTCYPVRLYFFYVGEWNIASNGYSVKLVSGDKYNGVLELKLSSIYCNSGANPFANLQAYPYKWKVELMNSCNQRTEMAL